MFHAHSTDQGDKSNWQGLADHLSAVGALASRFAEPSGLSQAAHLAGLLHDLGKYTAEFQNHLSGDLAKADHSTAGAAMVGEMTAGPGRVMAELIAYCIAGHHAGLPDKLGGPSSLTQRIEAFSPSRLDLAWRQEITPSVAELVPDFLRSRRPYTAFRLAMAGRMIFSCLVDADFKDTEAFYDRVNATTTDRTWPDLQSYLPHLIARFDTHMAGMPRAATNLNRLRGDILAHIRARAPEPPGLFTLSVPTGGGKTLASLAFALDHARVHGLTRIIYAIPFTSIIDQTADIFRKVLGPEFVLEHHSAIEETTFEGRHARDKLKLAMEDWAAPVVVTTNVQLFESLFAARPGRCRKLHRLARSVIVLDEAQTLPRAVTIPCVRAIAELAASYGATVVLCTATQPAFDARNYPEPQPKKPPHPLALPLEGRELAPDPDDLAQRLRRVTLRFAGEMANTALVAALHETPQSLVIVNTRKHALALYRDAKEAGLDGLIHLSTRHYAAHRRAILAGVRQRLLDQKPCRVIATSLIETGVDVDFPAVWRAEAGLDQIAQAAGRCNREGLRDVADSVVTVFTAPEFPPPAEIAGLIGDMKRMARNQADLLTPAAMADYFGEMVWRLGDALDKYKVMDNFSCDATGTNFAYRTVGETFRMIESGMLPVIVARDAAAKSAVEKLGKAEIPSGLLARQLQSCIVQVPPKARALLMAKGHVRFEAEKLRGDCFAVLKNESLYHEDTGLIWEDAEYLALEETVF